MTEAITPNVFAAISSISQLLFAAYGWTNSIVTPINICEIAINLGVL